MTEPASSGQGRWTLRRRIGWFFAALALIFALIVAAVVVSTVGFVTTGDAVVYRWQPAVTRTQALLTDLVDQETGLRGYALSHDTSYLQPYDRYHAAEQRDRAELTRLVGGDSALQVRLAALAQATQEWHDAIAGPAISEIEADGPAGVRLVESSRAKQLFDDIRSRAAELSTDVQARTAVARAHRADWGIVFVVAMAATAAVLLAVATALWRGLHRWVLGPVDRLGRQTREVATGDTYRQIVPTGPAELTRLGRDVEGMRLQIAGQLARAEEVQEELRLRGAELARSNDDLQQFAYVASHDLSEPLRKVANFCQLLERQYGDRLDDQARQYIDFAVDGAKRMQVLISDLLALSRVGRTTEEFLPVDLDAALDVALATLADRIAESGAEIDRPTALPTVDGDRALLTSLLENLVGNAVKYRRDDAAPRVRIAAEHDNGAAEWTFTVSDNGIGIDPEYAERIFAVFQRLHLRDSYGGTGIGLALCRKIVEFHGGRIWLEPVQSCPGATFRFTIPEGGVLAQPRD